jgi:hypothetical protein
MELRDLCIEFGKPLPFPLADFAKTLEQCEKILVDSQNRSSKVQRWYRSTFQEPEIDDLRKQLTGHYQALQICISFVQLYVYSACIDIHADLGSRLQLDAIIQTQRLLETRTPFITIPDDLSRPVIITSPAVPPQSAAGVLYKDWEAFDRWLKTEVCSRFEAIIISGLIFPPD